MVLNISTSDIVSLLPSTTFVLPFNQLALYIKLDLHSFSIIVRSTEPNIQYLLLPLLALMPHTVGCAGRAAVSSVCQCPSCPPQLR